ncbi:hypothetical protein KSS87_020070 [Heliosperma pusillum]|nr:hypothetical protein KSS87_020070 [Heliosperma pusillum]
MSKFGKLVLTLALVFILNAHAKEEDGKLGVTYDSRSLLINGRREFLYSGSVHYPRLPVEIKLFDRQGLVMHPELKLDVYVDRCGGISLTNAKREA